MRSARAMCVCGLLTAVLWCIVSCSRHQERERALAEVKQHWTMDFELERDRAIYLLEKGTQIEEPYMYSSYVEHIADPVAEHYRIVLRVLEGQAQIEKACLLVQRGETIQAIETETRDGAHRIGVLANVYVVAAVSHPSQAMPLVLPAPEELESARVFAFVTDSSQRRSNLLECFLILH